MAEIGEGTAWVAIGNGKEQISLRKDQVTFIEHNLVKRILKVKLEGGKTLRLKYPATTAALGAAVRFEKSIRGY